MMTKLIIERVPFPRVLRIEPSSQCNLACSHCPTGTVTMPREIMSETVFEKVLSEIKRNREFVKIIVLYHGGEPLLNRGFGWMVARIKQISSAFFVKTTSNGMALTKGRAEEILNSGLDAIEFSLDGESPDESEYVREKSNSRRIISNIQGLIAMKKARGAGKPDIFISTTQFLRDRKLTELPPEPAVPAWLERLFSGEVAGFKTTYAVRWPHMGKSAKFDTFRPVDGAPADACDLVINTLTIRANGQVVPCCFDLTSKLVMGNILEESLANIWNGRNYSALRQSILSGKPSSICAGCGVVMPPVYLVPKWESRAPLPIHHDNA